VADVVADAERAPLGEHVPGRTPQRHEQVRALTLALGGRRFVDLTVGGSNPHPVGDHKPHFATALHHLLDSLTTRDLDPDALLAGRLGKAAVGVVERERLVDRHVADLSARQPGHKGFGRAARAGAERGQGTSRTAQTVSRRITACYSV
jgi:hypothetical protein